MIPPALSDLPEPPPGRMGWPWTEASQSLPASMPDGREWPRITIVTPSFNQSRFIEETMRSVLLQGYPNLEYFVMDGGSTDGSVEIIKKYETWIDYWTSGPDGGQSAAINRGLTMGTGEFAAWVNSDDLLCQSALALHAAQVGFQSNVVYVGRCGYINEEGGLLRFHRSRIRTLEDLLRVPEVWRRGGNIVQPEVLFPRALALEVGALDVDDHYSMDYELWGKLLIGGARLQHTDIAFGMLRRYRGQKSSDGLRTTEAMIGAALRLLKRAEDIPLGTRSSIEADLRAYLAAYPDHHWRNTGRLARWGLPRPVVAGLRKISKSLG